MILNGVALVATIFILHQYHKRPAKPVHRWIRLFVLKLLAIPFDHSLELTRWYRHAEDGRNSQAFTDATNGLLPKENKNSDNQTASENDEKRDATREDLEKKWQEDWVNVTKILDRFFFVIYFIALVLATVIFIAHPLSKPRNRVEEYYAMFTNKAGHVTG